MPKPKAHIAMVAYTNYATDPRVIRQAEAAQGDGYQVDFYALRRNGEPKVEVINGVRVIHLNMQRYRGDSNLNYILSYLQFFLRCSTKMFARFLTRKYKVIHVNNMPDFMVFTAFLPKVFGAKVFLDIHDPMPSTFATKFNGNEKDLRYKLLVWQEKLSAKFADEVITVHQPVKELVLVPHGIPEKRIKVIANFADGEVFKLIEDYQIEGKIKLIFHGTIAERFGLQEIIDGISRFEAKDKIYLKIIGEGDYSEELKKRIASHELEGVVEFDNNFYPVRTLREKIKGFHVGLACYLLSEATKMMLPLKMLEYMALGLPSISIKNEAIQYYFDEKDCFFYDPDNIDSFINLLRDMTNDPQKLLAKRNHIISIRDKFLWENQAKKYVKLIAHYIEK